MQKDDGATYDKGKEVDSAEMKTECRKRWLGETTRLLPFLNIFLPLRWNR
jgi:hypothetical protein